MTKFPQNFEYSAAKNLGAAFDLNNLLATSGVYEVDTPTNGPGTGVWFVDVMRSGGVTDYVTQKASKKGANDQGWSRSFDGSTWSTWIKGAGLKSATVTAKTVSATLTAAQLLGGLITVTQGAGANSALQLPLGTALDTALAALYPGFAVNDYIEFYVINLGASGETNSVTVNTGVTIVGAATQAISTTSHWALVKTGVATYVAYRLA